MCNCNRKGYSLLELVICISLIMILSGIGLHFYMQSVVKSRRADAQLALVKLSTALENYYLDHNTYKGATLSNIHFSEKSPKGFYRMQIALLQDGQSYAAKAIPVGAQAKQDKTCGTLILYTDGRRSYEGNDPNAICW